jgi:hypothetical protein
MLAFRKHQVRVIPFRWKDYRSKQRYRHKTMTLSVDEFIRRFLLHALPHGLHRIRYYGLFRQHRACCQPGSRQKAVEQCNTGCAICANPTQCWRSSLYLCLPILCRTDDHRLHLQAGTDCTRTTSTKRSIMNLVKANQPEKYSRLCQLYPGMATLWRQAYGHARVTVRERQILRNGVETRRLETSVSMVSQALCQCSRTSYSARFKSP